MGDTLLEQAATATTEMAGEKNANNLLSFGPTPMQAPPPPVQFHAPETAQQAPQNSFPSTGARKRHDYAAAMHSTASLIKAGTDYVQAKKQRALTLDITRLLDAQQGRTEAMQALQIDPNDRSARETLETNSHIINEITTDPKKSKMLQKAFDIDLFGTKGGKNKNEQMALQKAMIEWRKKQQAGDKTSLNPMAEAMSRMQPQRYGPSPEAQAQAQAIKSGLMSTANAQLKAYQENYKTLQNAKSAEDRTKAIEARNKIITDNAKLIAKSRDRHTEAILASTLTRQMTERDRFQTMIQVAKIHAAATDRRTDALVDMQQGKNKVLEDKISAYKAVEGDKNKTAQERVQAQQERTKLEGYRNVAGVLGKQLQTYNTTYKNLVSENEKMQKELDAKSVKLFGMIPISSASGPDAAAMRVKIQVNRKLMDDISKQMDMLNQRVQQMGSIDPSLLIENQPKVDSLAGGSQDNAIDFDPAESDIDKSDPLTDPIPNSDSEDTSQDN